MSRKNLSFGQLVDYVNREQSELALTIYHNFKGLPQNPTEVATAFTHNASFQVQRKGRVRLFHEVLSFSAKDAPHVTDLIMLDLTEQYLHLRAKNTLAYAKVHRDTQNPHVHLILSGNLLSSSQQLRFTRSQFNKIHRKLEAYQRQKYPQLQHSLVWPQPGRERSAKTSPRHPNIPTSQKEVISAKVVKSLSVSRSQTELAMRLEKKGLQFYLRGKTAGVLDLSTGRKYRLKTLGIDYPKAQQIWQTLEERARTLTKHYSQSQEQQHQVGLAQTISHSQTPLLAKLRQIEPIERNGHGFNE